MTNAHLEMTGRKPAVDAVKFNGLFWLLGRLSVSVIDWMMGMAAGRTEFDDLNETQLLDLGVRRVARRERWLDGSETPFFGDSEYRSAANIARESEGG